MTIEELERYCIREAVKSEAKEKETRSHSISYYHKGCADTYKWIAAVIQQNKERITPH